MEEEQDIKSTELDESSYYWYLVNEESELPDLDDEDIPY